MRAAIPGLAGDWEGLESAAATLDGWSGGRALLVIDDLHALEGTAAEGAIGRFVDYAPAWLAVLVGTRVVPDFNLSRLRVSGELLEHRQRRPALPRLGGRTAVPRVLSRAGPAR